MAHEHDGLARVFTSNAMQRRSHTQHKLSPVLTARCNRSIRVLLVVWLSEDLPERLHRHTFGFAWAHLLDGIIERQRNAERGRDDLCRLSCTWECAGNKDICLNLLARRQPV